MRNAIHFLGGSFTVYALMAACSAGGKGGGDQTASSGGAATQGSGGVNTNSGGADGIAGLSDPSAGKPSGMGGIIGEMMDPVPDAQAESGTRLKARYYVGEDGSRQLIPGWFDTQRNEVCYFGIASDGNLRCTPGGGPNFLGYFSDAG